MFFIRYLCSKTIESTKSTNVYDNHQMAGQGLYKLGFNIRKNEKLSSSFFLLKLFNLNKQTKKKDDTINKHEIKKERKLSNKLMNKMFKQNETKIVPETCPFHPLSLHSLSPSLIHSISKIYLNNKSFLMDFF